MRLFARPAAAAVTTSTILLLSSSAFAQTYTSCNPLEKSCPSDPALGGSMSADFTSGASSDFTAQGNTVSYGANGAEFTISQSGDSPQIVSNWYIMFGKVEIVMKAAPGVGIVSSAVLQSDDLDEIDWEWLGYQPGTVQTNYFGKGITGAYDRGTNVSDPTSQSEWNTYTVDWTSESITWSVNGNVVRTLTPATAETNQYPQTPMQVKIGSWSAGDPANQPGVIHWAGGYTNYGAGPYTMYVQSVAVQDYSTGSSYSYSGTTGNWQSIVSSGGTIYSGGSSGASSPPVASGSTTAGSSQSYGSSYATTLATVPSSTVTTYPGLPSGWTVLSSGMVVPPSSATTLPHSGHTSYSSSAPLASKSVVKPVNINSASSTNAGAALATASVGLGQNPTSSGLGSFSHGNTASGRHLISAGLVASAILCAALLL